MSLQNAFDQQVSEEAAKSYAPKRAQLNANVKGGMGWKQTGGRHQDGVKVPASGSSVQAKQMVTRQAISNIYCGDKTQADTLSSALAPSAGQHKARYV